MKQTGFRTTGQILLIRTPGKRTPIEYVMKDRQQGRASKQTQASECPWEDRARWVMHADRQDVQTWLDTQIMNHRSGEDGTILHYIAYIA